MIYTAHITTPANTAATAPVVTNLQLVRGVIHLVEFEFPPGNQFLHRLKVLREGRSLFPTNPDGYLTADGNLIAYREYVEIRDIPTRLRIETWNLDDTYDHAVLVRVGVLPKAILTPWLRTWQERLGVTGGVQ